MTFTLLAPATVFSGRGPVTKAADLTGWLGGIFDKWPYVQSNVTTPSMDHDAIDQGVKAFDGWIRATTGNIILLGHSQGAQVISTWMDLYADDPTAPGPDRMMAVLTGNPLRHGTGDLVGGFVISEKLGERGKATRVDTPWPILDIAKQYDGYAIKADGWRQFVGKFWDHSRYPHVDLNDPPLAEEKVGNTTLLTYP